MRDPVRILYDGDCGLCERTVGALRRLDFLKQVEWIDFRIAPLDPVVDPGRLEHEMAAIAVGRPYFGFSAYRVLSWRLPLFWPLLPFLYLPGARTVGDAVYRQVAKRRYGICSNPRHSTGRKRHGNA